MDEETELMDIVRSTYHLAEHFDAIVLWTRGYAGDMQPYLVPRAIADGTATVCDICRLRH